MIPDDQIGVLRILDASFNRAAEGMRVVEDYVRFVLDDRHLTELAKQLRHDLAIASLRIASADRHAARETQSDVGTAVGTDAEGSRDDPWHVCAASLKRVEQALRSIEEFGKIRHPEIASCCEALRYRTYTLERAIDLTRVGRQRFEKVRLYVLHDARESLEAFEQFVRSLASAGVGAIQLRAKQLCDHELLERARALVAATRGTECFAIVNDRPDIAAIARADGVHLGQDDVRVKDARGIVGPQSLIGVSTHTIEQARAAILDGANYLGVGPTFPSTTKSFDEFPGLDFLREVAAEIRLPAFAIGGIDRERLPAVLATGVNRIAVGSAVANANDPAQAAVDLLRRLG
jgi:thiamine-phosphate pyrophosphorylase